MPAQLTITMLPLRAYDGQESRVQDVFYGWRNVVTWCCIFSLRPPVTRDSGGLDLFSTGATHEYVGSRGSIPGV